MAVLLVCFASLLFLQGQARAVSVDLNDFYVDPSVTVASNGSFATLAEDSDLVSVWLSNDPPAAVGPGTDIPLDSMSLTFDYEPLPLFWPKAHQNEPLNPKVFLSYQVIQLLYNITKL